MSGCQLVVFNQVHTEVSPMRLVKEGEKKERKVTCPVSRDLGFEGWMFQKKETCYKGLRHEFPIELLEYLPQLQEYYFFSPL